ncbi:hypothetical protein ACH4UM_04400 [Streptomyces sp. NPDC020801]|uniref:hypothetical protein n=1 Tax=Streptomyces sp. NPDC020801 TaxID=3365093 RepID=UPI00378C7984
MTRATGQLSTVALPAPAELLGDALPAVLGDCSAQVGDIGAITRLTGGNVSHVFRVEGARGSVVLKVRAATFARIPSLRTDPALIADERRALEVYGALVPSVFPRVLAFHPRAHAMVMTDVFPDRRSYEDHLHERSGTPEELGRLGAAVRQVHDATKDVRVPIRSQGDLWFRDYTFDYCLRASGHPVLERVCGELRAQLPQRLVLGDLAPKNLSLADGRVAFCDLDNVHRSRPLFDLGYLLAHILLHHINRPERLPALVSALLDAYYADRTPSTRTRTLVATVAAGVIFYRLDNATVPYRLATSAEQGRQVRRRVAHLLDRGTITPESLNDAVAGVA